MIQRIVEVAATPFDVVGLTLVSTLFALGVVEHWFMLLPLPAITLWGWGMRSPFPPEDTTMEQGPDAKLCKCSAQSRRVVERAPRGGAAEDAIALARGSGWKISFARDFASNMQAKDLPAALSIGAEPAATVNGRTS